MFCFRQGIKEKGTEPSESEITEMEVRVDPMTILQYLSDQEDENSIRSNQESLSEKDDEPSDIEPTSKTCRLSESENQINNKNYISCQLCPRSFISDTALQMHMLGHPSQPKRILSFNNMQQNINQVVKFETVEQSDATGNNNNHINTNNNINIKYTEDDSEGTEDDDEFDEFCEQKSSSCPICGKIISNKGNLKIHLETHRPKGRYACDFCGRM